eukprot:Opistho-2@80798
MDTSQQQRAVRRIQNTLGHLHPVDGALAPNTCAGKADDPRNAVTTGDKAARAFPTRRQDVLKWNGWGYADSKFQLNSNGQVELTGTRYSLGGQELPHLREWMEHVCDVRLDQRSESGPPPTVPEPIRNEGFIREISGELKLISFDSQDRLFRSHGHTCYEIFALRNGVVGRVPDVVVWPTSHAQVEVLMAAATRHNVCVIPFGGGTSVSRAVECPANEKRMIVSLDTTEMCNILWIDKESLMARVEAGIIGQDLERRLAAEGLCSGHEPDSMEFSSLGGWISTRASGIKKNVYGNIEDIVVRVRMVTPTGTIEKNCQVPRMSIGPDVNHFVMGSEGILGVVTEATIKVRPLPKVRRYGSAVFPDFESGVAAMREVALRRCAPASIRLVDNQQFQFSHALKPHPSSSIQSLIDAAKKFYVTKIKGFKPDELCAMTLLFEGETEEEVAAQQKRIYDIATRHAGLPAGEENGKRGYFLTFVIAYLRDIGFDHNFIAESFETSVPWSHTLQLCRNVKAVIRDSCARRGIAKPFVSCRVTQTYDTGSCVYFYFGFVYTGLSDPIGIYHEIEEEARAEVLANAGSASHHHGIGKLRMQYVTDTLSEGGVEMLRAVKERIDPKNIMGAQNLIPPK